MKEFYTDDYKKLIEESRFIQSKRAFSNYGFWKDVQFFTTSLDLGRQTGKTKAIVSLSKELGGTVIYVGHHMVAAEEFKALGGRASIYTSTKSVENSLRGKSIDTNQVTFIFDECDLRTTDMFRVAHLAANLMIRNGTWGNYVHIIRLGM